MTDAELDEILKRAAEALRKGMGRLREEVDGLQEAQEYSDKVYLDFMREYFGDDEGKTWLPGFTSRKFVEMVATRFRNDEIRCREMGLHASTLRVCLLRYGQHYQDCDVTKTKSCNCGLEANIQQVPGELETCLVPREDGINCGGKRPCSVHEAHSDKPKEECGVPPGRCYCGGCVM